MRVVRHWNRLSRKVVNVPSTEVFKVILNGALSNLILWKTPQHGDWTRGSSKVLFNPIHSVILWFANCLLIWSLCSFNLICSRKHCSVAAFAAPGNSKLSCLCHSFFHLHDLETLKHFSCHHSEMQDDGIGEQQFWSLWQTEGKFVQLFCNQRLHILPETPPRVHRAMFITLQSYFKGGNISGLSELSQKGPARNNLLRMSLVICHEDCWQNYS